MPKLSKEEFAKLKDDLTDSPEQIWENADPKVREEIVAFCERYKKFMDAGKTERMGVDYLTGLCEENGFKSIDDPAAGDKVYLAFRGKLLAVAKLGTKKPSQGMRIVGAHLDAPRLDLKVRPLYEKDDVAYLKTHYYGGIKKYHWLACPLAMHGVVCTTDGKSHQVHIGDDLNDPVLTISDLAPHLGREKEASKSIKDAFQAERLNIVFGTLPVECDEKGEKVKLAVLSLLNEKYGIKETDLSTAELEVVPAGPSRDVGFDRSLIGAYGHDDRVCSYTAFEAVLNMADSDMTAVAYLVDKEEIGSEGSTGAQSHFLEHFAAKLMEKAGEKPGMLAVSRALAASQAISADVTAAYDPDLAEHYDKTNSPFLGCGISVSKYTGSGGKGGASDADAEFVGWVAGVWKEAGVAWQASDMGKVDQGGGGTIAKFLAKRGIETVDAGPGLLSMHSPFEIAHKADVYGTYLAYKAFFEAAMR